LKGYLAELNAHAANAHAAEHAVKQAQAAAERDRRASLDDRLKHLLGTIPLEVQDEGLSIVEVLAMLRPRGSEHSCCNAGQLADALRRLGFVRERRWHDGRSSFRALWRKRLGQTPTRAPALIEDDEPMAGNNSVNRTPSDGDPRSLGTAPDCLENSDVCRGAPANGKTASLRR
jgi:hypothetical protein